MKKYKQINMWDKIKRELELKTKPPKSEKNNRKQWYRIRDKFERSLKSVSEIKNTPIAKLKDHKSDES